MKNKKILWKKVWTWSAPIWLLGILIAPNDTVGIILALPLGISVLVILDILLSHIPWVKGKYYKKGLLCALLGGIFFLVSIFLLVGRSEATFIVSAVGFTASMARITILMTLFYFAESFLHAEWVSKVKKDVPVEDNWGHGARR
ncbi:MAG: hypothetical protein A2664_03000 [Candidatus Taylorbacteria bacterium RIFCSPHIGHO2_01_FULL_46_22b]|uniref:Uncharacterized protein n=1 Tax=Candidatus Taylorbacteria bacterium RIFCSPHIGHO2_01_FULL_46_22b TaxID=1802301 RepID=A0A1G2M6B6_9BACT|nr:MAG: hypothetical protein A2664_03000 [Candidatus Taylorbacteria bacterium RIFCSPHIGHO2_01_FULL_46_22b]